MMPADCSMSWRLTVATDVERDRAHRSLMDHLNDRRELGCCIPCMETPAEHWTSEDMEDQQYVARLCQGCAGLSRCREYITTHPEPTAVWAGLTTADRGKRRGRPRKDTT